MIKVFLCTLNMSFPYPLDSVVSDEKLTVNNIENPLYVMSYFSCCFQDSLSWSLTFNNLIIKFWGMAVFELILLGIVEILGCIYLCLSSNFGCFQAFFFRYFFFCPFLSSPSGTSIFCRVELFMVLHRSLRCCLSFFILLSVPYIG